MTRVPSSPLYRGSYTVAGVTRDPQSGAGLATEELVAPVAVVGTTWENAERRLVANPATGVVGWENQWALGAPNRKHHELIPNKLTADYTSIGMEGAPVLTGSAGFTHAVNVLQGPGHFLSHETGSVSGDWCTTRLVSFHELFRWSWNPTVAIWFRTASDITNERIWIGPTREELNGLQLPDDSPAVAGTVRAALIRYDTSVNENWHAVWFDGTAGSQDLEIPVAANTTYRLIVEYDQVTDEMRWYLYNWTTGTNHGLVHSRTMSIAGTLTFGTECLVETLEALSKSISIMRIAVEVN